MAFSGAGVAVWVGVFVPEGDAIAVFVAVFVGVLVTVLLGVMVLVIVFV